APATIPTGSSSRIFRRAPQFKGRRQDMPTIHAEPLKTLTKAALAAAGTPEETAECVAQSLVEANLKGVDSHGVMRIGWHLEQIRDGVILPAAIPSVEMEKGSTAILRG